MTAYRPEPPWAHTAELRDGVLLVNLGSPAAPTAAAVRRYLAEFLADPRVVEIPRAVWLPVLYGIVLTVRPARSAHKYAQIWTEEGSPLTVHTRRQTALLAGAPALRRAGAAPQLEYAMRYGEPSIASALDRLRASGCDRIVVVPLYPQYAASTTAAVHDAVGAWVARTRNVPELRLVRHFHDHAGYVGALAAGVRRHWEANGRSSMLVMSFHGLPRASLEKGDPYFCECQKTARLLAEALGLGDAEWRLTFQSRFGPAEWLAPYTQPTLVELARAGSKRVDVVCPGFVADCLETLEEIGITAREAFRGAGGETLYLLPCLNESPEWIDALAAIVLEQLWPARPGSGQDLQQRAGRARAHGAPA